MTTSTTRGEFTHGLDKPFSVSLWGSNPDETGAQCLRVAA